MNDTALEIWNSSVIQTLTPTIVITALYCIFGLLGNTTVLVVYKKKWISGNGRFFIPILAGVDFLASFVCSICVLMRLCFNVTFYSEVLCRSLFFIIGWIFSISIFIVLAIAYDRYRMVCQINKLQLTERQKWIIVAAILAVGVIINVPVLVTTGNVSVHMISENNHSIQGSVCVFSKHVYPTLETAHSIFVICVILSIFFCVMFFNIKIAYTVWVKFRISFHVSNPSYKNEYYKREHSSTDENMHSAAESTSRLQKRMIMNISSANDIIDDGNVTHNTNFELSTNELEDNGNINIHGNESLKLSSEKESKEELQCSQRLVEKSKSRDFSEKNFNLKHLRHASTRRQSVTMHVMFSVMFIVMLLAYIPSLVIIVIVYNNRRENSWWVFAEGDVVNVNIYILLKTSYLLSSAANPYIYSLFDKKFQKVLKEFVKCKYNHQTNQTE